LILTQCNGSHAPAANAPTPTTVASSSATQQQATPTEAIVAANTVPPPSVAGTAQGGGATPAAAAKSKYMVVETTKGNITIKLHTEPEAGVSKTIANFEQKANSGYF